MKLKTINNVLKHSLVIISFCVLSLGVFYGISFSESPGIKITQPQDGTIVTPGQEITVTVEAVEGFKIKLGRVGVAQLPKEKISSLPITSTVAIPKEAVGKVIILAFGTGEGVMYTSDSITLIVQQTATLLSLEIDQDEIWVFLDWDGNIKKDSPTCGITTVYGIYSDGIKRILDDDPNTTYTSSDPTVVSVDKKGDCQIHKVGQATITVSNSGISKVIPVVFREPIGLRPLETIPPTTTIDIQPQPNSAGWNNTDITITLTAQDNEGGSGVQYIDYRFPKLQAEYDYQRRSQINISFSDEGEYEFEYSATDNEANNEDLRSITIRLDKTPPTISLSLIPINLSEDDDNEEGEDDKGNWYELSYSATDSLSGLKNISCGLITIPINDFKVELNQHNSLEIRIDEEKKELNIKSPDPQELLTQLQSGLLTLNNNQILQLRLKQGEPQWKLREKQKGLEIQAPCVIFKATASDYADNISTEEVIYHNKH